MSVYDWSPTADDNAVADSSINWQEGQNANTVNNSARAMMAGIAAFLAQINSTCNSGGSSNAYTLTSPSGHAFTEYLPGMVVCFRASHTNSAAATLNVDGLGAKSLRKFGASNLVAGDIASNELVLAIYDGERFQILSALGNDNLVALSGLSGQADRTPYFTGAGAMALATLTAFGRDLIDSANASDARGALGLGSAATANTGTGSSNLPTTSDADGRYARRSNNLSDLSSASSARSNLGLGSLATQSSVNNSNWSGTDLAVSNGGTGASNASGARSNLGIGSMAERNVTISTSAPSGGSNGDVHLRYS